MKKLSIFLLFLFGVALPVNVFAQKDATSDTIKKKNLIYAELLGKGGYYSLNYERRLVNKNNSHINVHIGLAYPVGPNFVFKNSVIVIPISFYYSYGKVFHIEAGLGINQYIDFDPKPDYYREKSKFYSMYFSPSIGFRFEFKNGFFVRPQYCPFLTISKDRLSNHNIYLESWLGISFGYQF